MSRPFRIAARVLLGLLTLLLIAVGAGILVVRSDWLRERVRQRIVTEAERATGGRVEIGRFDFDWRHLVATVSPFVLHGNEPAGSPPLLRADSLRLGLKIISIAERKVDLAFLDIQKPQVRVLVNADGSTNFPTPKVPSSHDWTGTFFDLAVHQYEISQGDIQIDDRKTPLDVHGEDLRLRLTYSAIPPSYKGDFQSKHIHLSSPEIPALDVDTDAAFVLGKSGIHFDHLNLAEGGSRVELQGSIANWKAPAADFTVRASAAVREAVNVFHLPLESSGTADFNGRINVAFSPAFVYTVTGHLAAHGIGYQRDRVKIENANLETDIVLNPRRLSIRSLNATALGGTFSGTGQLDQFRHLNFEGKLSGFRVAEAAHILTDRPIPWQGTISGEFSLDTEIAQGGASNARVNARLAIAPLPGKSPFQGKLDVDYNQAAGSIHFGQSWLATNASRLDLQGTLGQKLEITARTSNLEDLMPGLALIDRNPPKVLPLQLHNGQVTVAGAVSGPLANSSFSGQLSVTSATLEGHAFDRFSTSLEANRQDLRLNDIVLTRGATEVDGQANIAAQAGSFTDAAISAVLNLRNAQLAELESEAGLKPEASGATSATARISGSIENPSAEISLDIDHPVAFREKLDHVHADLRYTSSGIQIVNADATDGPGKLHLTGDYRPSSKDWKNGEVRFDLTSQNIELSRIELLGKFQQGLAGTFAESISGTASASHGEVALTSLKGQAAAHKVTVDGQPMGDLTASAEMQGANLHVRAHAQVRDAPLDVDGSWALRGEDPGSAQVRFTHVDLSTVEDLLQIETKTGEAPPSLPFEGFVEGSATLNVPLRKLDTFEARVTLSTLQVNPKPHQTLQLGVEAQDVVVTNAKPIIFDINAKELRIVSAEFKGRDTNLEASGALPFDPAASSDVTVKGSANLAVLQLVNPDLLARGTAVVQASIRGSLENPQWNGRLTLQHASLYMRDLSNGVDNVNGSVLFDRNRATIEKLTAETGGGKLGITGFIEFGSTLTYRVQAQAQQVRLRYPEDVSFTFDAAVSLTGTSDNSTVSGLVTVNRAAISPRVDLGSLAALASRPTPTPAGNDYLRGMQFDLRIQSGPSFEFQTSLTQDVEAEIDLRLRGTPLRPILLGSISVDQGEIRVFGNRYTINRGDIRFLDRVRISPTLDMDLETRVRGITVNIAFTGTLEKMNINYSSDPPLQPRDIIALLAIGRDPDATAAVAVPQVNSGSQLSDLGGGLLGQALSEQLSSRFQRFFGASHVKIDPTLTGIDNTPQARLTIEQSVSRDITFTYTTNLNRTQEQIVRLEWDFSRRWSAVAQRDENGLFGIDFQYRRRF